ncbi:MarR family winged helix-turn-helix transcriptional regulator [Microvirga sp. W0021]|uniref:MarR family winged helix-turn-helix transcriptional regulator n=1 Tax=Hohaiivirga grylli TaxID=3133970 RepID=A0ABV0BK93_9HYPH
MDTKRKHPTEKSLGRLIIQAARLHRNRLNSRLTDYNMVAGQEQIMQILATSDKPISISELAALLGVKPPTVSKTVSRLSNLKLVKRLSTSQTDNRVIHVALTKEGQKQIDWINSLWDKTEAELSAGFDEKDQRRLRKLLRRIIRNFSEPDTSNVTSSDEDSAT